MDNGVTVNGLSKSEETKYEFLKGMKGVIHIGANTGQERHLYSSMDLSVLWIEPIAYCFNVLYENIKSFMPTQKAIRALLLDVDDKEVLLGIANNLGQSSSILPFAKHKEVWPNIDYTRYESHLTVTLSTLVKRYSIDLSLYDSLVLDVQGTELLVLEGAKDILSSFKFIRCEVADFEIYKDCCTLADLDVFMSKYGFTQVKLWKEIEHSVGSTYEVLYRNLNWDMEQEIEKDVEFIKEEMYSKSPKLKQFKVTQDKLNPLMSIRSSIEDKKTGVIEIVDIAALTSVPRLGFNVHWGLMKTALAPYRIPLTVLNNTMWWEQDIQTGLSRLTDEGAQWVLVIDFDSLFFVEDIRKLFILATRYNDIDVLVSWQAKRGHTNNAMVGVRDGNDEPITLLSPSLFKDEVTKIHLGQFGLTLIKTRILKDLPKPWFLGLPNPVNGEWDEGKTNPDIYFWNLLRDHGAKVYVANDVRIGHLDECVLAIDKNLQVTKKSIQEFLNE